MILNSYTWNFEHADRIIKRKSHLCTPIKFLKNDNVWRASLVLLNLSTSIINMNSYFFENIYMECDISKITQY